MSVCVRVCTHPPNHRLCRHEAAHTVAHHNHAPQILGRQELGELLCVGCVGVFFSQRRGTGCGS